MMEFVRFMVGLEFKDPDFKASGGVDAFVICWLFVAVAAFSAAAPFIWPTQ